MRVLEDHVLVSHTVSRIFEPPFALHFSVLCTMSQPLNERCHRARAFGAETFARVREGSEGATGDGRSERGGAVFVVGVDVFDELGREVDRTPHAEGASLQHRDSGPPGRGVSVGDAEHVQREGAAEGARGLPLVDGVEMFYGEALQRFVRMVHGWHTIAENAFT